MIRRPNGLSGKKPPPSTIMKIPSHALTASLKRLTKWPFSLGLDPSRCIIMWETKSAWETSRHNHHASFFMIIPEGRIVSYGQDRSSIILLQQVRWQQRISQIKWCKKKTKWSSDWNPINGKEHWSARRRRSQTSVRHPFISTVMKTFVAANAVLAWTWACSWPLPSSSSHPTKALFQKSSRRDDDSSLFFSSWRKSPPFNCYGQLTSLTSLNHPMTQVFKLSQQQLD